MWVASVETCHVCVAASGVRSLALLGRPWEHMDQASQVATHLPGEGRSAILPDPVSFLFLFSLSQRLIFLFSVAFLGVSCFLFCYFLLCHFLSFFFFLSLRHVSLQCRVRPFRQHAGSVLHSCLLSTDTLLHVFCTHVPEPPVVC